MTDKRCSVEGCDRKHCAKGFCKKHYTDPMTNPLRNIGVKKQASKIEALTALTPTPEEMKTLVALHKAIGFILTMYNK